MFPDAELAGFDAEGVLPDGVVDLVGGGEATYRFVTASSRPACAIAVYVADTIEVSPIGRGTGCPDTGPPPTCSAREVLARSGIPIEGAWVELGYSGAWSVNSEDSANEDYYADVPDDCVAAPR